MKAPSFIIIFICFLFYYFTYFSHFSVLLINFFILIIFECSVVLIVDSQIFKLRVHFRIETMRQALVQLQNQKVTVLRHLCHLYIVSFNFSGFARQSQKVSRLLSEGVLTHTFSTIRHQAKAIVVFIVLLPNRQSFSSLRCYLRLGWTTRGISTEITASKTQEQRERDRERKRNYFRAYESESNGSIPIPKSMEKQERNAYSVRFNLIGLNFIEEKIQHVQVMILDLSGRFSIIP